MDTRPREGRGGDRRWQRHRQGSATVPPAPPRRILAGQQSRSRASAVASQAESASSILVTRSSRNPQVRDPGVPCCPGLVRRPAAGGETHLRRHRDYGPHGPCTAPVSGGCPGTSRRRMLFGVLDLATGAGHQALGRRSAADRPGRPHQVHVFFRHRSPARMPATAAPWTRPDHRRIASTTSASRPAAPLRVAPPIGTDAVGRVQRS
jgi:hypothetical protein